MNGANLFIITGGQGQGKTTLLRKVAFGLKERNVAVTGFYAEGEWSGNERTSFQLCDIRSDEKRLLCSSRPNPHFEKHGRFYFDSEALEFGRQLLSTGETGVVRMIDEIGRFEINGQIWADLFRELLGYEKTVLLITVRDVFLDEVLSAFGIIRYRQYLVQSEPGQLISDILATLKP